MGWKEGQGLGKEGTGMTAPIVAVHRDQRAGIGRLLFFPRHYSLILTLICLSCHSLPVPPLFRLALSLFILLLFSSFLPFSSFFSCFPPFSHSLYSTLFLTRVGFLYFLGSKLATSLLFAPVI
jgi:hypothetical protein